ncbi:hypothetical protein SLNWT_5541 [Streptomyces albus]|uniref:Uncharacterized protein n=1 Tax=Streptomyces albus (strain ATCC 21838 / DSM 41398 / FERM P-419 / JCM 4703 / NBRC 107858) TaxID=1081613 RepID=A0A0B5F6F9_STRA4|nr:hypothetical protein SLNWT_5541 [Streptomyces albus]AOU80220.1 hypothetical protein SLNHY_5529 [Streptomyces albus]AYN35936.1 hypothetical protein DUI70_5440 [Streptomyces albus]
MPPGVPLPGALLMGCHDACLQGLLKASIPAARTARDIREGPEAALERHPQTP